MYNVSGMTLPKNATYLTQNGIYMSRFQQQDSKPLK